MLANTFPVLKITIKSGLLNAKDITVCNQVAKPLREPANSNIPWSILLAKCSAVFTTPSPSPAEKNELQLTQMEDDLDSNATAKTKTVVTVGNAKQKFVIQHTLKNKHSPDVVYTLFHLLDRGVFKFPEHLVTIEDLQTTKAKAAQLGTPLMLEAPQRTFSQVIKLGRDGVTQELAKRAAGDNKKPSAKKQRLEM